MAGMTDAASTQTIAADRWHNSTVVSSESSDQEVLCKIASSRAERESAFRLTYEAYMRQGIQTWNPHGMRVTPHHLLPTTEIFIRMRQGAVSSTVSLVLDGRLGLPLESVFAGPIEARRREGLILAEASCLASSRKRIRGILGFLGEYGYLMRMLVQYARHQDVHQLLVAVHPRHASFYMRQLGFELLDIHAAYPDACNRPAVALCLDFDRIDRNPPRCYDAFFGESVPPVMLQPQPMAQACCDYFRNKLEQWKAVHPLDGFVSMFPSVAFE